MLLLLALPGFAQDSAGLGWSIALGGRFRALRDPVASVHAPAESVTLICPSDRGAAGVFFSGGVLPILDQNLFATIEGSPLETRPPQRLRKHHYATTALPLLLFQEGALEDG